MHGFIFSELRKYADTRIGSGAWNRLLESAGLGSKLYLPIQEYPDADAVALVVAAARETGASQEEVLEDFGRFLAPSLLGLYRTLVNPEWKTLDLLEHTEHTIHSVVRARNPGAKPANLQAVRLSPDVVDLTYSSQRRLCPVAKGIIQGMAAHYGEDHHRDGVHAPGRGCLPHGGANGRGGRGLTREHDGERRASPRPALFRAPPPAGRSRRPASVPISILGIVAQHPTFLTRHP
jgi:hypothetical protein